MKHLISRRTGRGFAIITVIVLVVVLAALGVAIAVISTSGQVASSIDLQGARAYQAARAGVEWGSYQVWNSNPTSRISATCPIPSTVSFTPTAPTLASFTVTVSCLKTADPSGFGGPAIFTITSVACNMPSGSQCPPTNPNAGSLNYVERRITVTL